MDIAEAEQIPFSLATLVRLIDAHEAGDGGVYCRLAHALTSLPADGRHLAAVFYKGKIYTASMGLILVRTPVAIEEA